MTFLTPWVLLKSSGQRYTARVDTLAVIVGTVTQRHGRGRQLGFPTANIMVGKNVPDGVFAGTTGVDGRQLPSVIFVGAAETFGDTERVAESYLFDWSGDLYGKSVRLVLHKKLRESKKFHSSTALLAQMREDERQARAFFLQQQ